MYSLSTRANAVFFYGMVCMALLCCFNILTTITHNEKPIVKDFKVKKFTSLYTNPYTKVQHSMADFDIDVDFTPVYNWNTNLVFSWISASYQTGPKNVLLYYNTGYYYCNCMG
jgi:hypothetical protein